MKTRQLVAERSSTSTTCGILYHKLGQIDQRLKVGRIDLELERTGQNWDELVWDKLDLEQIDLYPF